MGMSPVQSPRALCQEGLKLGVLWFAGPPCLEILDFIFECVLCRWRVMEQGSMCWAGGGRPATASPFLGSVLGYVLLAFGHFTPLPHCWTRTPRVARGGGSTGTSTGVGRARPSHEPACGVSGPAEQCLSRPMPHCHGVLHRHLGSWKPLGLACQPVAGAPRQFLDFQQVLLRLDFICNGLACARKWTSHFKDEWKGL